MKKITYHKEGDYLIPDLYFCLSNLKDTLENMGD